MGFSGFFILYPLMSSLVHGAASLAYLGASVLSPTRQGILEAQPHSQACDLWMSMGSEGERERSKGS